MANTNVDIIPLRDIKHFKQRIHHNNRDKNLNDLQHLKYQNVVEIIDPNVVKKEVIIKDNNKEMKRGDYTKQIGAYNGKIKNVQNDLNKLLNDFSNCTNDLDKEKVQKKIDKKNVSLLKYIEKVKDLTFARDKTQKTFSNKKLLNRKDFYELRFSITKPPLHLQRDINYGKDLLQVVKDYVKNIGLDMDIHSYSLHLDQFAPHIHILSSLKGKELTLNQQFKKIFEKEQDFKTFHSLQKDFNTFVKEHSLIKKYDLNLGTITKGGLYDYRPLAAYKKAQEDLKIKIDNKVDKMDNVTMKNEFKKLLYEKFSHKSLSKNLDKYIDSGIKNEMKNFEVEIKTLENDNTRLKNENKALKDTFKEEVNKGIETKLKKLFDTIKPIKKDKKDIAKDLDNTTNDNNLDNDNDFDR